YYCNQHAKELEPIFLAQLRSGIKLNLCLVEAFFDDTIRCGALVKEWLAENSSARVEDLLTATVLQAYTTLSTFEFELCEIAVDRATSYAERCSLGYLKAWPQCVAGLMEMQRANLQEAANHFIRGVNYTNKYANESSYLPH
ncbi:MAG: hypothetical protein RPR91_09600, partial [Colwellia sp.]